MSTFKGGIQKGTMAFDAESMKLDKQLKGSFLELKEDFTDLEAYAMMSKEMKMEMVGDNCFGFAPDGGIWLKDGKLVACFEAKKQGTGGNAYERWWDNAMTARFLNPDVKYVTFCTGEGAAEGECLDKLRRKAGIMMGENFSFHMAPNGFTHEEVKAIMEETLKGISI